MLSMVVKSAWNLIFFNKLKSQHAVPLLWRGRHSDWLVLCFKHTVFPIREDCWAALFPKTAQYMALGGERQEAQQVGSITGLSTVSPEQLVAFTAGSSVEEMLYCGCTGNVHCSFKHIPLSF